MGLVIIYLIFLGIISGLSEALGVLPDGPLNATVGGTVILRTTLNPTETPFFSVGWSLDVVNNIITSSNELNTTSKEYEGRITLYRSTGSLELSKLKHNDSGSYMVTIIAADFSIITGQIELYVHDPITAVVTPETADLVEFNSSVSLTCSSSESPLSYLWINISSEVSASDRIIITDGGSKLTIVNVTRYDQGIYYCHVSGPLSNDSDSAALSVSYGPENILLTPPSKNAYVVGSSIRLKCSAESRPPATFTWFLDGNPLPDSGPELQISQSGIYSCQAFNSKTLRYQTSQLLDITVKGKLSPGVIAAIVITCLAVPAASGVGFYVYKKKK